MRLTRSQIITIKKLARKHFGQESTVYLFGSRTDDHKKGGDIDLFIKGSIETTMNIESKIRFLAELKTEIGDRKIDVVFDNDNTRQKTNFYHSISIQKVVI